jgi:hypothetical protein
VDLKELREPFHPSELEWRVQSSGTKDGRPWARVLVYVTNRAIMARLDAVCGPEHWRNEFIAGPGGGILCGLSIYVGEALGWVTKWDGASETDIEAVKGGLSAAMKRAAVQWGIGRYLYQLEEGWAVVSDAGTHSAKTKEGQWFRWDPPALPAWALPEGYGGATTERERTEAAHAARAERPTARPQLVPNAPAMPAPLATVGRDEYGDAPAASAPAAAPAPHGAPSPLDPDAVRCPTCDGRMWDNRADKRNPKAPDFKCRDKSCDGVIWPPRDAKRAG